MRPPIYEPAQVKVSSENGSRRFSTRFSGRSHSAKVAVWREEENREMNIGAEGTGR